MIDFEKLFPKDLYHSYILEGNPETTKEKLLPFLVSRGYITTDSPDLISQTYQSLTMSDSEEIKDWYSKRGITKGKRICILATMFINREAEQALLKIIEEPTADTHFFIIINLLIL